ncbi:phosphoribosylamine--glycine ligase [Rothia sp. P13129]|uniref:phosphoribosylamine--glycine ligase n=1 Tax=unclassified Rothia (in: high G+C Gram-positive bacteria) TaxID=2689056 RepID=UPI003ABF6A34
MKVLVLGPGGREHAIIRALQKDPQVTQVHSAPGNAGIAQEIPTYPIDAQNPTEVIALAQQLDIDLVVIGPEAPLVAGVANALRQQNIPVFGPDQEAAALEGSKAFAKEIMAEAQVPTALAKIAHTMDEAIEAIDSFGAPYVVKDDGLAAGKGVVVTSHREEALAHAQACFNAGSHIVVEEYLDGPEVSLFVISDGERCIPLEPAQDFKRIFDQDRGANTGGMGAYSPLPWLPKNFVQTVMERVAQPTITHMKHRGTPFVGVLYCGLVITSRGIRVIEFNARFGDPETQAVLARLKTPLGQLLYSAACSRLDEDTTLSWDPRYAVDVVMAAENYPETPRKGDIIRGLDDLKGKDDSYVIHAGTTQKGKDILTSGGRVLAVVGLGDDLNQARERAYEGVQRISWEGAQYRQDIALAASQQQITVPEQYS